MHRAFSFPVTVERSRTKERLEASLAGLCELELRKQRQECLVLGALALGDPLPQDSSRGELACFSSWGQENLTLRRQLSALQSSPWGLMQALEQQVGELRIDAEDGSCDGAQGDTGDSRPSSGFYESSGGQSPKGRACSTEPTETVSPWGFTNDRPKSVDPLMLNEDLDAPVMRTTLPRSFSAPYPPLEGIAEEGAAVESWQWDPSGVNRAWQQHQQHEQHEQSAEDQVTEEDYQQALRVESYILGLIQRRTLAPRPCQPRTTLSPDPPYCGTPGHSSLHRRTPSLSTEQRLPDPHIQSHVDLSANPRNQGWGCDLLEGEACEGEAPSLEEDSYLALPYPQPRPHSLVERLPSPLPSLDPNCGVGVLDLCCEPPSPQHYLQPQPPIHHKHTLVSAHYIPGHQCHASVRSPRHHNQEQLRPNRAITSPDHPNSKSRSSKKSNNERQRAKKSSSKTSRSQSENSLLGQRVLPERRYSTTERHQVKGDCAHGQGHVIGQQAGNNGHNGNRRWCSNLELSQDEGETQATHRRPPRKARHGHPCPHSQPQNYHHHQQHTQRWHPDCHERAPICQGEEGYSGAAPAESESSMSEVYSPASSSLSSDSDESGGLVWPQQLPPRLASTSSSSSPSPQATANTPAQPKAFVKIKASHALKKKILRFRSGSLKVMTTV
ncbi:dapper homolog 3-like isoform X1 [Xyrichtys novacula]|uniref:Dapper homolog 3-like isoform X1 n=1 Tax=Xyrichtys novacula TaxID=13765 RepID=A0AAV1FXK1_XYRNO|nr:dapper homolog 3-like isoform X1 [Xyrichtys novacula]